MEGLNMDKEEFDAYAKAFNSARVTALKQELEIRDAIIKSLSEQIELRDKEIKRLRGES